MEEILKAALASYHNLPEDQRKLVTAKFKEIDSDGSGTISIKEFKKSMGSSFDNDSKIMKRSFKELDKNGDGKLDFNEYITLYYLVESGRVMVYCAGHGCEAAPFLKGLYFTCVHCFNHNKVETFDLCTSCYRNGAFDHDHTNFADNHILLLSKAACSGFTSEPSDSESDQDEQIKSKRLLFQRARVEGFKSLKDHLGLGDVSAECSIM